MSSEENSESSARLHGLIDDIKSRMSSEEPSEVMRLRTIIDNVASSLERDPSFRNVARNIGVLREAIEEE